MFRSPAPRVLGVSLGVIGLWFGFPNPIVQLPLLALAYPFALLWLSLDAQRNRWAVFRVGTVTGIVASTSCLYWLAVPLHAQGQLPWIVAVICTAAIGGYVGLYAGVFCLLVHLTRNRLKPLSRGVFVGSAWVLLETARGVWFSGFPWLTLSAAFAPWPLAMQGASLVGAYWVSGIWVAIVCWVMGVIAPAYGTDGSATRPLCDVSSRRDRRACALAALVLVVGLVSHGAYQLSRDQPGAGAAFRVALVQSNIDQNDKWEETLQRATVERYLSLSAESTRAARPDLLVWPETAMPFYFQEHPEFGRTIRAFAASNRTPILLGTPGYARAPAEGEFLLYNRAWLLDASGRDAGHYDKQHLVPFGEYIPLGVGLPFLDALRRGVGDFSPGTAIAPLRLDNLALGVLICYEMIFPELAQQRVAEGANVLVNISNDAWFGATSAPEQHLQLSVLRAVEQSRYVLRGTSTGISTIIDPYGRIVKRSDLFKPEVISGVVMTSSKVTVFHRVHDGVWPMALAIAAAVLLFAPRQRS